MLLIDQMCMSVLGLGSLTIYMPEPVMRGFVTGAAVHVAISQLKYATGIPLYDYNGPLKIIKVGMPLKLGLFSIQL